MRIYQAENYQAMSRRAANIISAQVIYKPNCVLGLATGGTPVGAYNQLVEWYEKGDLSRFVRSSFSRPPEPGRVFRPLPPP